MTPPQEQIAKKPTQRLLALDFAKGIAIILIVWAHADLKMNQDFYERFLHLIHEAIYSFHIALFFIISGALAKRRLDDDNFDLHSYITKLATGILVPFFTLNAVFFLLQIVVPQSFTNAPSPIEMLTAMAFFQSHANLPSGVLWFLFTLFTAALLNGLAIKKIRLNIFVWLGLCLLFKILSPLLTEIYFLGIDRLSRNLFFFALGNAIAGPILLGKVPCPKLFFPLTAIAWAVAFFFFFNNYYLWVILTGVTGSLLIIGLSFSLNQVAANPILTAMHFIGTHSILIFVLHMPVLLLTFKVIQRANLETSLAGFSLALLAGIFLPLAIGKCISPFPTIYRTMFGHPYK